MMKNYDRTEASKLLPLLDVITREISERSVAVRRLTRRVTELRELNGPQAELLDLEAELAGHKRELRHARTELESLGCAVDDAHPLRIMIRGSDGTFDRGYLWDVGTGGIHETAA